MGVVSDGPWQRNEEISQMIQNEIIELTKGEFVVQFPEDKHIVGDWTAAGVERGIDKLLVDPEVDFVLAMGVIASSNISLRGALPKPAIAPFVIDATVQGLPQKDGASGVKNLNYLAIPSTVKRDVRAFQEIASFEKMAILVNPIYYEALPLLKERLHQAIAEEGIELEIIPVNNVDQALNDLTNSNVEAVYVAPLIHLGFQEFDRIIAGLIERKLPSFSLFGRMEVERGLLAGLNPDIFPRISRRVALNVQKILLGQEAGELPFAFAAGEELAINMETARAINVFPPWSVMTEAVLLNEKRTEVKKNWTLISAVLEGIEVNLDLLAKNYEVAGGRQIVKQSLAPLLPQVDLYGDGAWIDEDRAGIFQAEKSLIGGATLTQLIYSDDAWANYSVQKQFQRSLEEERYTVELDIGKDVATAYLNVLITNTIERIQKVNLRLSRENLELARVREAVGYSGRAEVLRWESEIANNRQGVIQANASRNVAEIQFNRLLQRPGEEKFALQGSQFDDPGALTGEGRLFKFMTNPLLFKTLRTFLVEEGIKFSPEIKQIDAAIDAQQRILTNTNRSLFLPDLAAFANVSYRFWKDGVGSESSGSIPGFEVPDDQNWTVGLNLTFPLITGGQKFAERGFAVERISQLKTERASIVDKIEQRIRSAAHQTGASYASIKQFREAAEASRQNLELVIDSYSEGVVSVTELIDAQNTALVSEATAANSVYNFLIDLIELERAIGVFNFLRSPEEQGAFFERVEDYFEKAEISVQ
jgi:outer membrane protein TolC